MSSYIKISSRDLGDKLVKALAETKRQRNEAYLRCVERNRKDALARIEKDRNSLWSSIFGYKEIPLPTIQESLEKFKNDSCSTKLFIDLRHVKYFELILQLSDEALASDEVFVSISDISTLNDMLL